MRLTRYQLFLLGGLFLVVMGPLAFTQPGPGGRGGRGGKGGKGFDSEAYFLKLSGGKDSFDVKTVQLPNWGRGPTPEQQKEEMMVFLQKKGVTNGTMTKALFVEHSQERMAAMRAQWEAKSKQDAGASPAPAAAASPSAPEDVEAKAREEFADMDADKNGSLTVDEMRAAGKRGRRLFEDREKWDANKNGTIELPEYIAYSKDRAAQRADWDKKGNQPTPAAPEPVKPVEEDKRPTVYRTGKFPKELPAWFEAADKDKDGQVGLYEWKSSGKPVSDFLAMDLNGDGFLTAEEVLRYQRTTAKATPATGTPATPSAGTSDSAPSQGGNQRGGRNGGGRQWGNRPPKGG